MNCVDTGTKGDKMYLSMYVPGQNWARFEKKYLPSAWSYQANILMVYFQGGGVSARKRVFF